MKKWTNEQLLMLHLQYDFNLCLLNTTLYELGKKDTIEIYLKNPELYCKHKILSRKEIKEIINTFRPL